MSEIEALFLGQSGGLDLWRMDDGADDDGVAINPVGRTAELAPGGEGGEALFAALYVTLTHTMAATVRVTPIVDGTELADEAVDIALLTQAGRTTVVHEIGLSVPLEIAAVVRGRVGMIGTRIAFRLEVVGGLDTGELILDQLELEAEVLRESRAEVGA